MARNRYGKKPVRFPEITFVGSAVPASDHVASVNGVPLRVPVMSPPVAVYVRFDASAADEVANMQANAISPTETVLEEMRIMIVALVTRSRCCRHSPAFLHPPAAVSNNWSHTTEMPVNHGFGCCFWGVLSR